MVLGTSRADEMIAKGVRTALFAMAAVAAGVSAPTTDAARPAAVELNESALARGAAGRVYAGSRRAWV
jgi:hypothetical protein